MNAGTHLGEASSRLQAVTLKSLSQGRVITRTLKREDLKFSYRKNLFLSADDLVFSCVWKITHAVPREVQSLISETLSRRKATQPIDKPSCGSVFKNPNPDLHAWQVIDKIGLRGHQVGDAQFSEKHCNFIVNKGQAKARDVKSLIDLAKAKAQSELGVLLEEEVKYLGTFTELSG